VRPPPAPLRALLSLLLLPPLLACSGSSDGARQPDSATSLVTAMPDTLAANGRYASDGTLVIQISSALHERLRAVTDSFAAREAIRVVFSPHAEGPADRPLGISPAADLVVVSGDLLPRLLGDASVWALPFAELLPDSATTAAADSAARAARGASAQRPVARPARRATGRRADSIRADSARRAAVRDDSSRLARAGADSARTLVLTVPAQAPNSAVAERFVRYMLTEGRATLLRSGLHVLPRLELRGHAPSPGIAALVDTMIPADTVAYVEAMPPG
jgi:hypothetical protein